MNHQHIDPPSITQVSRADCPSCDGTGWRHFAVKYERVGDPGNYRLEIVESIEHKLPPMYFYDQFPGYQDCTEVCECVQAQRSKAQLDLTAAHPDIPEDCWTYSFDDFKHYPTALSYARQIVEGKVFDQVEKVEKVGILLGGPTGTGKTTLTVQIVKALSAHHARFVWVDFNSFMEMIRETYQDEYKGPTVREIKEAAKFAPFLIVDDLGSPTRSGQRNGGLYAEDAIEAARDIFNHRLAKRLPTVVTTNLNKEMLYDQFGPRVVSRLRGLCASVLMTGGDYRAPGDRK